MLPWNSEATDSSVSCLPLLELWLSFRFQLLQAIHHRNTLSRFVLRAVLCIPLSCFVLSAVLCIPLSFVPYHAFVCQALFFVPYYAFLCRALSFVPYYAFLCQAFVLCAILCIPLSGLCPSCHIMHSFTMTYRHCYRRCCFLLQHAAIFSSLYK